MLYFHSDIFCLMVIMLSLNQAALLSIQLLVIHQVIAGIHQIELRNKHVSEGDSVMFTCNASLTNVTQIAWSKDRYTFVHSFELNKTFSNFTSHRLRIDPNSPTEMNIFDAQPEDAGLYTCNISDRDGLETIKWNLTVSKKPEEISFSWSLFYILTSVFGFFACGFTLTVCLCRKHRAKTQNRNPVQDQFHLESGGEVVGPQLQAGTNMRANNNHRSQYMERLNSIYGVN